MIPSAIVMATPPVITLSAPDVASSIAGSVLTGPVNTATGLLGGPFRYAGSNVTWLGAGWPVENFIASRQSLTDPLGGQPYAVEFITDADAFEVWVYATGGRSRFTVNGQRATLDPMAALPSNGSLYYYKVQFASAATRVIRWDSPYSAFGGVRVGAAYSVTPPTGITDGKRMIVLGDSFVEGVGALSPIDGFAPLAGYGLGHDDSWASGSGSTGYLAVGGVAGKVTFRSRAQNDVLRWNPEVIVVAGGLNDGAFTAAQLTAEAGLLFAMLKGGAPDAQIVVLSPFWPNSLTIATILPVAAAIQAAALTARLPYVDMLTDPWITGSGKVGATNGTGNADIYISSDGAHPSPAGHVYIAGRLAAAVLLALTPVTPAPTVNWMQDTVASTLGPAKATRQTRIETRTPTGGTTFGWATAGWGYCSIAPMSADEVDLAGRMSVRGTHTCRVAAAFDVDQTDRITIGDTGADELDGLWEVTGVITGSPMVDRLLYISRGT